MEQKKPIPSMEAVSTQSLPGTSSGKLHTPIITKKQSADSRQFIKISRSFLTRSEIRAVKSLPPIIASQVTDTNKEAKPSLIRPLSLK